MKRLLAVSMIALSMASFAHADGVLRCQGTFSSLTVRIFGSSGDGYDVMPTAIVGGESESVIERNVTGNTDINGNVSYSFTVPSQDRGTTIFTVFKNGFVVTNSLSGEFGDHGPCQGLGNFRF